ncbi:hypothetical protein J5834_05135 [bacterium]|nr:hypothetical protein [bacterium]
MADKKKNKILALFFVLLSVALAAIFIFVKESREEDLPEGLKQELSSKLDSSVTFIAGEYEKQKLFDLYMCSEDHSKCVSSAFSTFTSVETHHSMHDMPKLWRTSNHTTALPFDTFRVHPIGTPVL